MIKIVKKAIIKWSLLNYTLLSAYPAYNEPQNFTTNVLLYIASWQILSFQWTGILSSFFFQAKRSSNFTEQSIYNTQNVSSSNTYNKPKLNFVERYMWYIFTFTKKVNSTKQLKPDKECKTSARSRKHLTSHWFPCFLISFLL